MTYSLSIKKAYNIKMHAPSILGFGYDAAVISAFMDYETARAFSDVDSTHAAAYSGLPLGTPRDTKNLTYIKIITSLGEKRYIAQEWISEQPIEVSGQTIIITISGKSVTDIPRLRDVLNANGFTNISFSSI